ncbi:MAG: YcfL family protein [Victivallales bacterium]|nr:YcfL family protein [Victivallales bacterium]
MKKLSLFVLCALVGLLAGCRHSMNSIENAEKAGVVHPITDMRFVMDETLAKHVALLQVDTARNANNLLEVQLEAANYIHKAAKIKYQFTWFNAQGMQVKTVTSDWEKATLLPGQKLFIRRVAPQPDCADFKINLIYDK